MPETTYTVVTETHGPDGPERTTHTVDAHRCVFPEDEYEQFITFLGPRGKLVSAFASHQVVMVTADDEE
jgi:hypothetical protein